MHVVPERTTGIVNERERKAPKGQCSFRLATDLIDALQARAAESGSSLTALVERYLSEGLRRDRHPLIVFREGAAGRREALAGTRLDVAQVIGTLRGADNSAETTAEYLAIPEPWVMACVRYYAEYQDEVDAWLDRTRSIAQREEAAWRREQALLA
jgi:uncharacterized protein (DUF433 family)